MPSNKTIKNTTWSVPAVTPRAPREPATAAPGGAQSLNLTGYGTRSRWPYPPIGESAQRDPHVPDPVPGLDQPAQSQAVASPQVDKSGTYEGRTFRGGGGVVYNGLPPAVQYIKRIGSMLTSTLARSLVYAQLESRWRVGGVTMPLDYGYGPGYVGDAQTLWLDNPQAYLRNPGIRPLAAAPATYRYAPNMPANAYYGWTQNHGPSIGDVGNTVPIGQRMTNLGQ
jgi:hypothetical protein